ncbi:MAG: HD domain-containing protein [Candidatus Paceibacterota bacterium]|jgi:predicted hydrolase (HD superfamily)
MNKLGISYDEARALVNKYIPDKITQLHLRETEVFMRALARRLGEDEEEWGIIGLLHDLDWELTKNNVAEHCVKVRELLQEAGGTDYLIETITSHGYGLDLIPSLKEKQRSTNVEYCLAASETLTGIIIAAALVLPDKKLASVQLKSLGKRFKEKAFAAKCDRQIVLECEKANIPLEEFLQIGLTALQGIASELEL